MFYKTASNDTIKHCVFCSLCGWKFESFWIILWYICIVVQFKRQGNKASTFGRGMSTTLLKSQMMVSPHKRSENPSYKPFCERSARDPSKRQIYSIMNSSMELRHIKNIPCMCVDVVRMLYDGSIHVLCRRWVTSNICLPYSRKLCVAFDLCVCVY